MTNEEIKQNAEDYAWSKISKPSDKQLKAIRIESYIAGAHSRDKEVERLKKALSSAQKAMAELDELGEHITE